MAFLLGSRAPAAQLLETLQKSVTYAMHPELRRVDPEQAHL
jgi:hypothetical protein